MRLRLSPLAFGALLAAALLVLAGCTSMPARAPDCHGAYTPINTPDHYALPEKKTP